MPRGDYRRVCHIRGKVCWNFCQKQSVNFDDLLSPRPLYALRIFALEIGHFKLGNWSLFSVSKYARVRHNFRNFSTSGRVNCPSSKSPYLSEKEFLLRGRARISRYCIWCEESFIINAVGENIRPTSVRQLLQLRSIQAISIWHFPPQSSFSHIAFLICSLHLCHEKCQLFGGILRKNG